MSHWWKSFKANCKYLGASLAIVLVKRQVGRRPHDWSLWLLLGRLYSIGHQWPQAINCLKRAKTLNPQHKVTTQLLTDIKEKARESGAWPAPGKQKEK